MGGTLNISTVLALMTELLILCVNLIATIIWLVLKLSTSVETDGPPDVLSDVLPEVIPVLEDNPGPKVGLVPSRLLPPTAESEEPLAPVLVEGNAKTWLDAAPEDNEVCEAKISDKEACPLVPTTIVLTFWVAT